MKRTPYKFVTHDVPTLESLKDSRAYRLREKLNAGLEPTREEKNWLAQSLVGCTYSHTGIALMGWIFPFDDILNRYAVKQHGHLEERFAPDKTSLRKTLCGPVEYIAEIVLT